MSSSHHYEYRQGKVNFLLLSVLSRGDNALLITPDTPTNKVEVLYKYVRNLKNLNTDSYIKDFKTTDVNSPLIYDQLDCILATVNDYVKLVKTKSTRTSALSMEDLVIKKPRKEWETKTNFYR